MIKSFSELYVYRKLFVLLYEFYFTMHNLELSEQEIIRRQSLDELRQMGIEPYPASGYEVNTYSHDIKNEFEDLNIIVSSIRLDNFVAEIANCSRTNASDLISEGRVFVNSINEFKDSKKINIGDLITIRGKGKFIFDGIEKETRSGRYLLNMRKYK